MTNDIEERLSKLEKDMDEYINPSGIHKPTMDERIEVLLARMDSIERRLNGVKDIAFRSMEFLHTQYDDIEHRIRVLEGEQK